MFPLRDDVPTETTPFVNYMVIAACAAVFLMQSAASEDGDGLIYQYGMVPARISQPDKPILMLPTEADVSARREGFDISVERLAPPSAVPPWMTLFTCIFLHGGLMHLVGNMWFLYIFGDNVEDRFGHFGYALMYMVCGVAASLGHLLSSPGSTIPTVGASGAIAGVLGAYFVMFRGARVVTLLPLGVFTQIVAVPAPFFLGLWFLFQFVSATMTPGEGGGVAWWAHIGGFIAGVATAFIFSGMGHVPRQYQRPQPTPAWRRRQFPWD